MLNHPDYLEELQYQENARYDRFDGFGDPDDCEAWVDRQWGKHLDDCAENNECPNLALCPGRVGLASCTECSVHADCPDYRNAEEWGAYYDEQADRAAWQNQLEWDGCMG